MSSLGRKISFAALLWMMSTLSVWAIEPTVKITLTVPDAASEQGTARNILTAGADPAASDGFDPLWDTIPYRAAILDTYFDHPEYPSERQALWQDIRSVDFSASGYKEWTIRVSSNKPSTEIITLSWSVNQSNHCQAWSVAFLENNQPLASPFSFMNSGPKIFILRITPGAASVAPTTPTGLWSPRQGASSLFLSWNKVAEPGVAGYNLYRQVPGGALQRINPTPLTQTAYLDTGLSSGLYTYSVTTIKTDGCESAPSHSLAVTLE